MSFQSGSDIMSVQSCSDIMTVQSCSDIMTVQRGSQLNIHTEVQDRSYCNNWWNIHNKYRFKIKNMSRCFVRIIISRKEYNITQFSIAGGPTGVAIGGSAEIKNCAVELDLYPNNIRGSGPLSIYQNHKNPCFISLFIIDPKNYHSKDTSNIKNWKTVFINNEIDVSKFDLIIPHSYENYLPPLSHWNP